MVAIGNWSSVYLSIHLSAYWRRCCPLTSHSMAFTSFIFSTLVDPSTKIGLLTIGRAVWAFRGFPITKHYSLIDLLINASCNKNYSWNVYPQAAKCNAMKKNEGNSVTHWRVVTHVFVSVLGDILGWFNHPFCCSFGANFSLELLLTLSIVTTFTNNSTSRRVKMNVMVVLVVVSCYLVKVEVYQSK